LPRVTGAANAAEIDEETETIRCESKRPDRREKAHLVMTPQQVLARTR
jgi:hypothetical protein